MIVLPEALRLAVWEVAAVVVDVAAVVRDRDTITEHHPSGADLTGA